MDILASDLDLVGASANGWKAILKAAFRTPADLAAELRLPRAMVAAAIESHGQFHLFAPRPFVELIEPESPDDPLLKQIWPSPAESETRPGESSDPVGDRQANVAPGLLRKYAGRALLVLTGACAVHCRYCFRREWAYDQSPGSVPEWEPSLKLIAEDRSISEVILSGGDPLMWDDQKLASLVERVESMPHVSRLRLHTRMPVVVPQRITTALLSALSSTRLRTIIVIHANHDRELSSLVRQATERMAAQGFALLNQSVLLAGVNDDVAVLGRLSERLFDCSVLPYYLHQLDRVTGSGHFQVPIERGLELVEQLRVRLPGFLVPRYVREMPGKPSKSVLA